MKFLVSAKPFLGQMMLLSFQHLPFVMEQGMNVAHHMWFGCWWHHQENQNHFKLLNGVSRFWQFYVDNTHQTSNNSITALTHFLSLNLSNYILSVVRFLPKKSTKLLWNFPPPPPPNATLPTIYDVRFGFLTQEWLNPPESVFKSLKTTEEQYRILADDDAYRQTVSPTAWSRYVHLGRPSTTGFHFDKIWNNFDSNPSLLYQLIQYTYLYHVDRKLDISSKLEHWVTTLAQPYLVSMVK